MNRGPYPPGERRVRVVVLAHALVDGLPLSAAARVAGVSVPTASAWREELRAEGLVLPDDSLMALFESPDPYRDAVTLTAGQCPIPYRPTPGELAWFESGWREFHDAEWSRSTPSRRRESRQDRRR